MAPPPGCCRQLTFDLSIGPERSGSPLMMNRHPRIVPIEKHGFWFILSGVILKKDPGRNPQVSLIMKTVLFSEGTGRTQVSLAADSIGKDLIVSIFNCDGHLGAVALADFDYGARRASTSVITRLGHKDDTVAYQAAHRLCRHLKSPVCVIAGLHVDKITKAEIDQITQNCEKLVDRFIRDHDR